MGGGWQVPVDNKTKSRLQDGTEPVVFVPEVAKQRDVFVRAIAFGALVSARARVWLDEITRKLVEHLNEDFQTEPELVLSTEFSVRWN